MNMLTLYDYYRSSASFRVRAALNYKGLSFETIPIHLLNNGGEQHTTDYEKLNPQKLVPTLIDDNHVLTQSLAIIEYLDELQPSPPLLPTDPYQRALARSFALIIAADTHPLINLRVLKYLAKEYHFSEEQKISWYQHWMATGLTALESQLNKHQISDKYCIGDEITLVDICLTPQLYSARRFNCRLDDYPTLLRIDANCQQHAAFKQAWPVEPITDITK